LKRRLQTSLHRDSASAYRGAKSSVDSYFPLASLQRKCSRLSRGRLTASVLPIRCERGNDGFPRETAASQPPSSGADVPRQGSGFRAVVHWQAPGARGRLDDRRGDCAWVHPCCSARGWGAGAASRHAARTYASKRMTDFADLRKAFRAPMSRRRRIRAIGWRKKCSGAYGVRSSSGAVPAEG
jgi:hypothetical protein